jgi:ABC-type dipeptide/oligopeptide/nickel transport system permease component
VLVPGSIEDVLNAQLIMAGDGKALKRAVNYVMSHAGTLAMIPALGYVAVSAIGLLSGLV